MKISIIIPVYNEEKRIISLLDSVVGKVDEVIIIDKSSTDSTVPVISNKFNENVKVVNVPFSEKGKDDFRHYCEFANNDWVMVLVASEKVPTNFWRALSTVVERDDFDLFDLIMVPRLYYCFGINVINSPWDIAYFPFMFNRKRIIFNNILHSHFSVKDEKRKLFLSCDRDSMIQHFTHIYIDKYLESVLNYTLIEVEQVKEENIDVTLKIWVRKIYRGYVKLKRNKGRGALAHFAAWNIYWSVSILKLLENKELSNSDDINMNVLKLSPNSNNVNFLNISLVDGLLIKLKNVVFKKFYNNTSLLTFWSRVRNFKY